MFLTIAEYMENSRYIYVFPPVEMPAVNSLFLPPQCSGGLCLVLVFVIQSSLSIISLQKRKRVFLFCFTCIFDLLTYLSFFMSYVSL